MRRYQSLRRRSDFARVQRRGQRQVGPLFVLLSNPARDASRVGITVSKAVGNAVVRNRIRRRLREALRRNSCLEALPDHDYVLMARLAALTMSFEALVGEIDKGFRQIRRDKPRSGPRGER